jgi:hypothetical protein
MSLVPQFLALLNSNASDAVFHRVDSLVECPCRTPEGFRDPAWHLAAPAGTPMCNEEGMLPDPAHSVIITVKAFVQPIQSTRATRLSTEALEQLFGTVRADDHLGIFPIQWAGKTLDFRDWSMSGEDYIEYDGQRFLVVNANKIPDPSDGNPDHHWEVGMRLIDDTELV